MIWFTSDTHFWHRNIILYCNRPYSWTDEMNLDLIKRWNTVVEPDDEVYFLGDFAFCSKAGANRIGKSLSGKKYFIRGNHDRKTLIEGFEWVKEEFILEAEGKRLYLCHFPKQPHELPDGIDFSLHGHCHGKLGRISGEKRMDVGVDCNDYNPVSLVEVMDAYRDSNYA